MRRHATGPRSYAAQLRLSGIVWLTYGAVALGATVAVVILRPQAGVDTMAGVLAGVSVVVVLGFALARLQWGLWRIRLETAERLSAPDLRREPGGQPRTLPLTVVGAGLVCITAVAVATETDELVKPVGYLFVLFGMTWLDLARRVQSYERRHGVFYYELCGRGRTAQRRIAVVTSRSSARKAPR